MATLLKVLINLADIKSAGGVALRVGIQEALNAHQQHGEKIVILTSEADSRELSPDDIAPLRGYPSGEYRGWAGLRR